MTRFESRGVSQLKTDPAFPAGPENSLKIRAMGYSCGVGKNIDRGIIQQDAEGFGKTSEATLRGYLPLVHDGIRLLFVLPRGL